MGAVQAAFFRVIDFRGGVAHELHPGTLFDRGIVDGDFVMSMKAQLKKRKPNQVDLPFCMDRPIAEELRQAELAVAMAAKHGDSAYAGKAKPLVEAEAHLKDVKKRLADATVTVRLSSVPWERYTEIMLEHPPRDGKTEEFNSETFFKALARETAVEVTGNGSTVPIHDEDWDEFVAGLTDGEHDYLAETLVALNRSNLSVGIASLM